MSDIRSTIFEVIGEVAPEVDFGDIDSAADLRDELDIDSMDFLNVLVGIHGRLGVEVPEQDYGEVQTLDALVAYVQRRGGS